MISCALPRFCPDAAVTLVISVGQLNLWIGDPYRARLPLREVAAGKRWGHRGNGVGGRNDIQEGEIKPQWSGKRLRNDFLTLAQRVARSFDLYEAELPAPPHRDVRPAAAVFVGVGGENGGNAVKQIGAGNFEQFQ